MSTLAKLRAVYSDFLRTNMCIFKRCDHSKLVVMEKLPESRTNEHRHNVADFKRAKFRTDVVKTLGIYDLHTQKPLRSVVNQFRNHRSIYSVGQLTRANDFENNPHIVRGPGIHYFNTLENAFFFRAPLKSYSGPWFMWYSSGVPLRSGDVVNGKPIGIWKEWNPDGSFNRYVKEEDLKTIQF